MSDKVSQKLRQSVAAEGQNFSGNQALVMLRSSVKK
jgi:hypothetical protein